MQTLTLTLQTPGESPVKFEFKGPEPVGVGRRPGNTLCIPDGRVSGLHGELRPRRGEWYYRDLQSTNGSMVLRGEKRIVVDGKNTTETVLHKGDVLLLGDVDDPIVLAVAIAARRDAGLVAEGTVVARRAFDNASDLSLDIFGAPGAADADLMQLLRRVGGEIDAKVVFEHVARFAFERLPCAVAAVLCPAIDADPVWLMERGATLAGEVNDEPPPYPRELVGEAFERREALLSSDLSGLATEHSLARVGASVCACVPLLTGEARPSAVLAVSGAGDMGAPELDLLVALSWQVSNAFATARLVKRLRAVERRLRDENRYLRAQVATDETFGDIIGSSAPIRAVFEKMKLVMDTDATVLITGETGTGKELVARALHHKSRRRDRLFAPVNCAALSENLLESELFGHVKGAFTGAHDNKKGLFQVADGGTLFLDEIGELSLKLQVKLLRVLQEGEVLPVGSSRPVRVDVRIVCATHRDLKTMAREGDFREDLYYRVNVFPIHLPPLRDRGDDIIALGQFFLDRYARKFNKRVGAMSQAAAELLKKHTWPGNIRELENEMQRGVLLTQNGASIEPRVLSDDVCGTGAPTAAKSDGFRRQGSLKSTMEGLEREVLRAALEEFGWNRSQTARELKLSRQALMAKLAKYQLVPD